MTRNEMWELYREVVIEDIMDEMWLESVADTEAFELEMEAAFYTLLVDALKADVIALEDIL